MIPVIRNFVVLIAFVGAGSIALTAPEPAPAPRLKKPTLYYPTTVGAKWVYKARDDEFEKVVTGVKEKDGIYVVSIATRNDDGKLGRKTEIAVSEQGLAAVSDGKVKFEGPSLLLRLPPKEGKLWFERDDLGTYTVTQGKPRQVKVPAGEFEAIPIESERWVKGEPLRRHTQWYAPGVGLIKVGAFDEQGIVLKSFTRGQEESRPAPKDKK
jgi:hypothetical protein